MDCPRTIKGQTAAEVGDARDALVSHKLGDALDTFFVGKLEMISFGGALVRGPRELHNIIVVRRSEAGRAPPYHRSLFDERLLIMIY